MNEMEIDQLMTERDMAEQALSHAYYLVMGKSPEWSNTFGHAEAIEDIKDACIILRSLAKEIPKQLPIKTCELCGMPGCNAGCFKG